MKDDTTKETLEKAFEVFGKVVSCSIKDWKRPSEEDLKLKFGFI